MPSLSRTERLLAASLLAAGAVLRCWDIGSHSQWYDEMLVSVHSSYSLAYLLDLSWRVEIHPPLYYLFNKLLQTVCADDAFLRLPSALAGMASLPLIGLIGTRLTARMGEDSRFIGLAAMGLACVNPMHIWISRQVRPYAIMQVFCCLGFLALFKLLEEPSRRNVVRLVLVNMVVALLHYLGLVLIASQGVCILAVRALRLSTMRARDILLFALLSAASVLPVLPFLVSTKWLHANPFLNVGGDLAETESKLSVTILQFLNFGYFDAGMLWVLPAAATALGLGFLLRADARGATACFTLLIAFPLMILAAGYSAHFTPVHLSYYLPLVFACQATALRSLLPVFARNSWSTAALAVVLCGVFLARDGRAFYLPDTDVVDAWHHQERYKTVARFLAANSGPQSFVILDNGFAAQAVDWYMAKQTPAKSLADYRIVADQPNVELLYLSKERDLQNPLPSNAFIRDVLIPPSHQGEIGRMDIYMLPVARTGRLDWSPQARLAGGGFVPDAFLRTIRSLHGVRMFAEHEFWLCPAKLGAEGEALFRFESPTAFPAGTVYLVLNAQVRRPGNRLEADVSFDGGETRSVLRLDKPYLGGPIWLQTDADKPFKVMDVRLRLSASGRYANLTDGPLEQVRVSGLSAYVPPLSNRFHSPGLTVAEQGLEAPEPDGKGGMFRWGLDHSRLVFTLERPGPVSLLYAADSPLQNQHGTVTVNGASLGGIDLSGGAASGRLEFAGKAGENILELSWRECNNGPNRFAPHDPRPLAASFRMLCLETGDGGK